MAGRRAAGIDADPGAVGSGDVAEQLEKLRRSVDALTQGLTQLLETTATHTELLSRLLEAATATTEPEQDFAILLKAVVGRLADQSVLLRALDKTMAKLPEDVGTAVASQMTNALAAIR